MKIQVAELGVGHASSSALAEAGYARLGLDIKPAAVASPSRARSVEILNETRPEPG